MDTVDLILSPKWLIPVVPKEVCLEYHSIVINQSRIIDILPTDAISSRYQATKYIKLDKHTLIPGLINAHTHAAMSLMRGLADDKALMDWLNNYIWPTEEKWVDEKFIEDGVELAIAEMLLSGTTCFNDMYFFPDIMARTADRLGMRAVTGLIVLDFPTQWATNADEYLDKGLALFDELRHVELVTAALAPHAPFTVSDKPLEKVRMLSDELDLPVHIHLHETAHEIEHSQKNYGKRPIARLDELNLLGPNLLGVHLTHLLDEEIDLLAEHGISAVHCPQSNMKLASGFCQLSKLLEKGINVGLGTDGAASNNDLDMMEEMRCAALLAKAVSNNPESLPAHQALELATLGGAKGLGLADVTGSLEVGKWADMTAIDLSHPACQPVYDPISQVVYTASRQQVSDVWVAGNQLVEDHELTQIDQHDCLRRARGWQQKISSH
ncbi:MAG: 5-methylthioadenosine/S-adenosylhomocysteine deaminase [bacterium]|nr:MAG: 5-methylthioadenosine/S-adenosylhomocysteine deaminase [bacterium]